MTEHLQWYVKSFRKGDKQRDPTTSAHFEGDALGEPAAVLVREGIQNALDACVANNGGTRHAKVRIFLSGLRAAVPAAQMKPFMVGLWDHLKANGNGLRDPPETSEECEFLVFEDFGTTGLLGSTARDTQPDDRRREAFYYFFRAEGQTGKEAGKAGSWGVGKHAFPRCSRMNGVFGLTIRAGDPSALLMGSITLKHHRVGTTDYTPDGWFGVPESQREDPRSDGRVLPVSDSGTVERFAKAFRLTRTTQPGLSIVVPYCDGDIQPKNLVAAVASEYFLPILSGQLEVVIEGPATAATLEASSLESIVTVLSTSAEYRGLREVVALARIATTKPATVPLEFEKEANAVKWSDYRIDSEVKRKARREFEEGRAIAFEVSAPIQRHGDGDVDGRFFVYLTSGPVGYFRPIGVRDGIKIPDQAFKKVRDAVALVVAWDGPMAELLRDAEDPGHRSWNQQAERFKAKYKFGKSYLDLVRLAPSELLSKLLEDDEAQDVHALDDVFQDPLTDEPPRDGRDRKPNRTGVVDPPTPPKPPKPRMFRIEAIDGGFGVHEGPTGLPVGSLVRVRVAYDRRSGNPFAKWSTADFDLGKIASSGLVLGLEGAELVDAGGNELRLRVTAPGFFASIQGFDARRDLKIECRKVEADAAIA